MRESGVLMHISSLPSPCGIGTMGAEARSFADFLEEAGQHYWQMLPVCPTSYGDSPYQSFSTCAGNPYFIDFPMLVKAGLLKKEEYETINWGTKPDRIDYGVLYQNRFSILEKAAARFDEQSFPDYKDFCEKNAFWLEDYALFMSLKTHFGGAPWTDWDQPIRNRDPRAVESARRNHGDHIRFWKVIQYLFFTQWKKLHHYCHQKNIQIIGDLPFYVAQDSVDVWVHPELFELDENRLPTEVAGCPPDGFSADGQLWGNPIYNWKIHKETGYDWWVSRIEYLCREYDILRIDHFRGFDSFYSIPYGETTARNGHWNPGPGMDLFRAVEEKLGRQHIIAEDLGFLTDSVRQLLADSGFPGMKVLQFAFDDRDDSSGEHRPYCYPGNCVAYIGTHDNDTVQGWMKHANPENVRFAREYLRMTKAGDAHWDMICALMASVADLVIIQTQDLLGLGSESRMNTPSTSGGNWSWRMLPGSLDRELAKKLARITRIYGR